MVIWPSLIIPPFLLMLITFMFANTAAELENEKNCNSKISKKKIVIRIA